MFGLYSGTAFIPQCGKRSNMFQAIENSSGVTIIIFLGVAVLGY